MSSTSKSITFKQAAIAAPLLTFTSYTLADADIGVQAVATPPAVISATTHVDLCVEVPEILIFGLGQTDDVITKVKWATGNINGSGVGNDQNYTAAAGAFTAPAPYSTTTTASIVANGTGSSAAGNTATLPVFLFANTGRAVVITATTSSKTNSTADILDSATNTATIPIGDFAVGTSGTITHPTLNSGTTTIANTAVVNLNNNWTYSYTPSTTPQAGTYEARVTYVATSP